MFHHCHQCKLLRPTGRTTGIADTLVRRGPGHEGRTTPDRLLHPPPIRQKESTVIVALPLHPSAHQRISASAHQRISASAHQRISASAHQRISASAHQRISASAHQRISASAHQRISASAHQRNPCRIERKAPWPPPSPSTGNTSKPVRPPSSNLLSPIPITPSPSQA
ncbi:hypothetical protein Veis_4142 [Verminephrobacter eiseniae EF01-2]|uniref:Uncharacterized protein n=1 Tax=Verminephrobacter eiseniae (strain EF01-2) TaxID=391735 RepID=A1WQE0_VEREI|nr:hypothetical protein Veis_4142 [Verminephrobacter eiseniae EF01-2]